MLTSAAARHAGRIQRPALAAPARLGGCALLHRAKTALPLRLWLKKTLGVLQTRHSGGVRQFGIMTSLFLLFLYNYSDLSKKTLL